MKKLLKVSLAFSTLLVAMGCSNNNETIEEAEPFEEIGEEEVLPSYTYPLSGMEASELPDQRVVGVTINNHPAARPQSGLADADIIYEILSEFEVTRLVALFHSQLPNRVGPVRSARPYHIDLVNGYNGLFVSHGWSPEARRMLEGGGADHLNGLFHDGTLFQRSTERKAPHNSYITFDNIRKGLEDSGYDLSGSVPPLSFYESDDIYVTGDSGTKIDINYFDYNRVTYQLDEATGNYHRFNGDQQTVDYETNEMIQVSNLLIIETEHEVLDDDGRRAINLTSGGKAILFQSGIANVVNWESQNGQIVAVDDNGEPVKLKAGQTWINVVPTSPGLEYMVTYE
ncbi:DUF3048 domain-containing protein [Alkalihalobacillus sp. MEB130]|uniref:DUF3048 domain-containing protein n=1 Tax=Alkalihalobacillus sp. MEB130 TaxID=2976704 RepID=UPI0028E09F1C|nr:DUF3048 domain-containing protein [Alkalihalobacillus sp. MEB130]MDT8862471.1 DUF3048 domain-containing protein [Alkalihalobacillus sp. MEB130]